MDVSLVVKAVAAAADALRAADDAAGDKPEVVVDAVDWAATLAMAKAVVARRANMADTDHWLLRLPFMASWCFPRELVRTFQRFKMPFASEGEDNRLIGSQSAPLEYHVNRLIRSQSAPLAYHVDKMRAHSGL